MAPLLRNGARLTDERRGCTGCSLVADHFDGVIPHLNGRDITLVCASLAPWQELQHYKRQMGWRFPWVSSLGSDFNYDFGVAFTEEQRTIGADYNFRHVEEPEPQKEGMSVFALQDGAVHHTYSTYARGVEALMGTYQFLDLAPWAGTRTGSSSPRRGGAATTSTTSAESGRARTAGSDDHSAARDHERERLPACRARSPSAYRAGSKSSIGFPSGSSTWICRPPGPASMSLRNLTPAFFSPSIRAGRSVT